MCMCVLPVSYPFCNDIVLVEIGVFKPQLFFASRTARLWRDQKVLPIVSFS